MQSRFESLKDLHIMTATDFHVICYTEYFQIPPTSH